MADHSSPRVNFAQHSNYVGQVVRLTGKVKNINSNGNVTVECSDGGEVEAKMPSDVKVTKAFVEFIGKVAEPGVLNVMAIVPLAEEMDMKMLNFVAETWHNPKYSNIF